MLASTLNQEMWKEATRKQRSCHVLKVAISLLILGLLIMFGGSEVEKYFMRQAADTLWAYDTQRVCGYQVLETVDESGGGGGDGGDLPSAMPKTLKTDLAKAIEQTKEKMREVFLLGQHVAQKDKHWQDVFQTYDSAAQAKQTGVSVAHCGDCGHCSNIQDITIIEQTKNSLTKTVTECAKLAIPFQRVRAEACMDKTVGFTEPCRNCWVDNIFCTLARCGFTCAKSVFLYRQQRDHNGNKTLNECLECDEKMCGPTFIQCAGANRRRSGIISDIRRSDSEEVCQTVDEDWKEWLSVLNQMHAGHLYKYADKNKERAQIEALQQQQAHTSAPRTRTEL
jgi:hypothetical protein